MKVLRPGIERRFRADLDAFTFVARKAESLSAEARRLRLVEVVETLRRSVAIEMDLRLEAAALPRWRRTPRTIPTSACRRSTGTAPRATCSRSNGSTARRCHDRAQLAAKGFDLKALAAP